MNPTPESDVYIVSFLRTAFSRSRPNDPTKDLFNSIRMDEALGSLISKMVTDTEVIPEDIGDVITGCALPVDENWTFGGRHPVFLAKLPFVVPSMTLDRQCSSSMNAISIGAMEIATGNADIVIAGGMEHMTHVPISENEHIKPNMKLLLRPEYLRYSMRTSYSMGLTAEKLAELRNISREDMDLFSYESHMKASRAFEEGYFKAEILPIAVEQGSETFVVDRDQSIRRDTTREALAELKPAFKPDGVITAGNSSPLNAGASAVMLMSGAKVKEYGITPQARILSFGWAAVDPSIMGDAIVPASQKALSRSGLGVDDIDIWEINEAFAVVALNAERQLGIQNDRVNLKGGAIAIGHPLGASGARIVGTLSRLLRETGKDRGMATLCVGGGQGYAMLIERCS